MYIIYEISVSMITYKLLWLFIYLTLILYITLPADIVYLFR